MTVVVEEKCNGIRNSMIGWNVKEIANNELENIFMEAKLV
jgi:hypothetical protein